MSKRLGGIKRLQIQNLFTVSGRNPPLYCTLLCSCIYLTSTVGFISNQTIFKVKTEKPKTEKIRGIQGFILFLLFKEKSETVFVVVVSHIQRIGCQPEKNYFYTVANPARGLLNREKRTKEKVWQHTPPPPTPPHCAFG